MKFLCEFADDLYPFQGVTNERHAARAFALDKRGRIALLYLHSETHRKLIDTYVTPGGGLEPGETPDMAVKREVLEEIGFECEIPREVGIVIDYYNDIKRKTISYYYIVRAIKEKQIMRTPKEDEMIRGVKWLNINEAIHLLENYEPDPRGRTLHRRDLCALREAKYIIENLCK